MKERGPFRFGRRREPVPPENVRMTMADGTEIPVDCAFVGLDDDGIAIWMVVTDLPLGNVVNMRADLMPARSAIRFPMRLVVTRDDPGQDPE